MRGGLGVKKVVFNSTLYILALFICVEGITVIRKNQGEYMVNNIEKCLEKNSFLENYENISVSKCYDGKFTKEEKKKLLKQLVKSVDGEILDIEYNLDTYDINGKNITRVFGYSRNLGNSSIYKGNKVNFNINLTYLEEDNKTNLYLGSPIVNIDY